MLVPMSPHDQPPQQPYSFGRDRYQGAGHHNGEHSGLGYPAHNSGPVSYGSDSHGPGPHSPASHGPASHGQGPYGPGIPPPPAGHRSLFTVVVLYVVGGFMVLWTGASAAVTIESAAARDGDDLMIGLFMTAGSIAITAGLAAWLIRIHRRRGAYRRILDEHYARQYGHYLDG